MQFQPAEIELARKMHAAGLPWQPTVGHFVYDQAGLIEVPSPFQDRVYFILDLKHFLRRAGTREQLAESLFWLPHYHQCRTLLRTLGVPDAQVAANLVDRNSIAENTELQTLYTLILERLPGAPSTA